jgi:hypothetical protein
MNSNDIKIPKHISIKVPEKSFFKKYTHKLDFEAVAEKKAAAMTVNNSWSYRRTNYYNVKNEVTSPIKRVLTAHETEDKKFDYRIRQEGYKVSLYFSDAEILQLILNNPIKGKATSLYRPMNDKHLEFMEIDKKIRVRKTLFSKYYKYKLYIRNTSKFRKEELLGFKSWLFETFPTERNAEHPRIDINTGLSYLFTTGGVSGKSTSWYRSSAILALYFDDEVDLMMAKLRLNEHISHIEEVILIKDL